ncbi:hypothetical protein BKA93DRAFT_750201 [Sparassis latifolia]
MQILQQTVNVNRLWKAPFGGGSEEGEEGEGGRGVHMVTPEKRISRERTVNATGGGERAVERRDGSVEGAIMDGTPNTVNAYQISIDETEEHEREKVITDSADMGRGKWDTRRKHLSVEVAVKAKAAGVSTWRHLRRRSVESEQTGGGERAVERRDGSVEGAIMDGTPNTVNAYQISIDEMEECEREKRDSGIAGLDSVGSCSIVDTTVDATADVSILEGVGVTEGSVGLVTVDRDKGYPPSPASTSPALVGVTLPLLLPFSYASGIAGIPEGVFAGGLRAIFFDGLVLRSGLSIKLGRGAIPLQVKRSGRTTSQHAAAPEQAVVMYCWLSHFPGW